MKQMKITRRQLRRIIREAVYNEGWFLMSPSGELAKSSQVKKPIWWSTERDAQRAYDSGYGAEGAKPVAISLVLDKWGYNGYGPDPQELAMARESRALMGESVQASSPMPAWNAPLTDLEAWWAYELGDPNVRVERKSGGAWRFGGTGGAMSRGYKGADPVMIVKSKQFENNYLELEPSDWLSMSRERAESWEY